MADNKSWSHINVSGNARVHLGDHHAGNGPSQSAVSRATALLTWLHFPRMESRQESVKNTYSDTFQWILRDAEVAGKPNPGFRKWLEHGSGIYWVAGKAGSGKSTLMKLITERPETQAALKIWAKDTELVCPSFYFWYGGTQMQRSQLGMLRALVHELILTNEALVPVVFPNWKQEDAKIDPDHDELTASLKKILHADGRKMCFFIDGLDEYEGNSVRLAEQLDQLARLEEYTENIKFVVSSRPLQELQRHIHTWPHLMLQDLTSNDISTFAEDKLRKNARMLNLAKRYPESTAELVSEVVDRANGVFLWVVIVVQSLLDGLENHDSLPELMAMLLKLPTELDELYSVM